MSITTQTTFARKKFCLERISARSIQDHTSTAPLFFMSARFKRWVEGRREEGRGAYKRFTRRAKSMRLAPPIRQQGMDEFVSSSESIQKTVTRPTQLLVIVVPHQRAAMQQNDSKKIENKYSQESTTYTSFLHIFYPQKGKINTEVISRGRCNSTTKNGCCPLQPIRHPPSRASSCGTCTPHGNFKHNTQK